MLKKQQMINQQILSQITHPPLHQQLYDQSLPTLRQKYLISAKIYTLKQIQEMAKKLNQKVSSKLPEDENSSKRHKMEVWGFGELKIFETVCVVYSLLHSVQLELYAEVQYSYLRSIFVQKTENFLKYEVASLQKARVKANPQWGKNEIQLYLTIIQQSRYLPEKLEPLYTLQWKYYSYQLFTLSQGRYYRTLQQCREKWTNYLNPSLNHAPWTISEDIRLFELIKKMGYKWSAISKQFECRRTENMVRNRFNSIIRSWKNKELKNVSPKEISVKVLSFLRQKEIRNENLQREQIKKFIDQEMNHVEQGHESKTSKKDILKCQVKKNELTLNETKFQIAKHIQFENQIFKADQDENDEIILEYKESVFQWNQHIELQNKRYEQQDSKECKKTWDVEAHQDKQRQSENINFCNSQVSHAFMKQDFESHHQLLPICSSNQGLSNKQSFNHELIEYLGYEASQNNQKDESCVQPLKDKDILAWLN